MKNILPLILISFIGVKNCSSQVVMGMTAYGGIGNTGTLFKYDIAANSHSFTTLTTAEGCWPLGSLFKASNGKLYGLASQCGTNSAGTLLEYDLGTNLHTKKYDFQITDGTNPFGTLIQASNGKLYGLTKEGGANSYGTLFEFDISASTFTKKYDFDLSNGANPYGALVEFTNGKLYGLTSYGGSNNVGVIFEFDPSTNIFAKKTDLTGVLGATPYGSLVKASNGKLYGLASGGGANSKGSLFEYDVTTNTVTVKYSFGALLNELDGCCPSGSLIEGIDGKLYGLAQGGLSGQGVVFKYDLTTSTYTKFDFSGSIDGIIAWGQLLQATNGKMYGLTRDGGTQNKGIIFEFDPTSTALTKKFEFNSTNGANPFYTHLIEIGPSIGIKEFNNYASALNVYPNPVNTYLTVESNEHEPELIEIHNSFGSLVFKSKHEHSTTVNTLSWQNGVYFLRVGSTTRKVVISH